jgi:hypothetical protein
VQKCKSRRNWLRYISKEDDEPYFNCKVSELSFRYRAINWAKGSKQFRYTDPFVIDHAHRVSFLRELHSEVHCKFLGEWTGYKVIEQGYGDWWGTVAHWFNDLVRSGMAGYRRKQMYLYGPPGVEC